MIVVLLGPPGAGKGTQGEIIAERLGVPKIATGDVLRAAVREGTEQGLAAKGYMDRGDLVPDSVILGIMKEVFQSPSTADGAILDGVVRTVPQAEGLSMMLAELGRKVDAYLLFDIDDDELVNRLGGRTVCDNCQTPFRGLEPGTKCEKCGGTLVRRKDDEPESIRNRLAVYRDQTAPVIDWVKEKKLRLEKIDASGKLEDITDRAMKALERVIQLKSQREIEIMARGGKILADTVKLMEESVKPGMTTADLDTIAEDFIRSHKGAVPSFKGLYNFPASICSSINNEIVHGIPSKKRVLAEGDVVSIDVGVHYEGYHTDSATTVAVGKVNEESARLLSVTRDALAAGVAAARLGNHLGDIGAAVQEVVEAAGFSVVRDLVGHGIGAGFHEEPQVPNYGKPKRGIRLVPGLTIAIEPMVNIGKPGIRTMPDKWTVVTIDGTRSAHFEHTVAITDEGPRVLTAA